jgi:hypothetical protein
MQQLKTEMNNYKLDILGVSEVCWNEFGEINTVGGKTFIFLGRGDENDEHKEGAGILITKAVRKSLIKWHPVSERLNKVLREKTKKRDIVILMGDMNAKVGAENEGLEHIMGKHGF